MSEQVIIRPYEGFQDQFVRSNVDFVIGGGAMSVGKAQPLDSLVCTPFGFRKIGDLKVGDIISNTNGGMQKVIQIFDRGLLPLVELTLADGRKIKCTYDHLWKAKRPASTPKRYMFSGKDYETMWEVMTTETIIKALDKKKRIHIPLSKPVQFTRGNRTQGLTIHPYVLGCLLGDGCLVDNCSPRLTSTDIEIVNRIRSFGYDIKKCPYADIEYKIFDGGLRKALKQKKLDGKHSYDKFVPNNFKYGSIEDRIELLRGLFDTDGYAVRNSSICFDVTSKQLAEDVAWIIHSLGGYASIKTRQGSYRDKEGNKIICRLVYQVYIKIRNAKDLFTLSRKKERLTDEGNIFNCEEIGIVSYEVFGEVPMICIMVSNPNSLYLTDNFVVTHNSSAAVMTVAEPTLDGRFRAVFLRNNLGDLKSGGGILDEFKKIYGSYVSIVESGDPHVDFPSGARIDVTHIADQSKDKVLQRFKGRQYDLIYFDEGTGFTWDCFRAVYSRNRGIASWTGKVRMTTNPKRNHWIRKFIDWYVGADGLIIPERNGVVRYFFINGETVNDVVWGDSKEEVYAHCRTAIDRILNRINGKSGHSTYKDMIKSFTFYEGKISGNKAILGSNAGYVGSVAVMGGRDSQANLEANWNVDTDEELNAAIKSECVRVMLNNDPCENGDKWITCDLADTGDDNFLCLAWNGLNIFDIFIATKTTPRMNADYLIEFADKHGIAPSHIIYDGVRGTYINDYIPDAIPFISGYAPQGVYRRQFFNLKTECYMRLVNAINGCYMSISDEVLNRVYEHQGLDKSILIEDEFIEECGVVHFREMPSGRITLWTKKEMNAKLGKSRSMDLLDPCAMRFYPLLEYPYGEELSKTVTEVMDDEDSSGNSIYDETLYG